MEYASTLRIGEWPLSTVNVRHCTGMPRRIRENNFLFGVRRRADCR